MKKQVVSVMLIVCMAVGLLPKAAFPARAYDAYYEKTVELDGLTYGLMGTSAEVIDCDKEKTWCSINSTVVIENQLYNVTRIGREAFSGCTNLTGVSAGPDIGTGYGLEIGEGAFKDCVNLQTVSLPSNVRGTLNSTFSGCSSLTSVMFNGMPGSGTGPYGDLHIGENVFKDCVSLQNVDLPANVRGISNSVFLGCTSLNSIHVMEGNEVYSSENGVLFNRDKTILELCPAGKTECRIPEGVINIASNAFSGCTALTRIDIESNNLYFDNSTFKDCTGLTSIMVRPDNERYSSENGSGVLLSKDRRTLEVCPAGKTECQIPEGVVNIADNAFSGCTALNSVEIPRSMNSIEKLTFRECAGLTSITVAPGNTSYTAKDGVLFNKAGTTLIMCPVGKTGAYEIPAGVTSVEWDAFKGCDGLTSITVSSENQSLSLDDGILFNRDKTVLLMYPESKTGPYAIPGSVTGIGSSAFYGCAGLTGVTIPQGVTSIGSTAFCGCTGLTGVTIPSSVTSIGSSAFQRCTGLTGVTIPQGVTSIGGNAFYGCTGLTDVTIPSGVTSIGNGAFQRCTGLTNVTIPRSVTSIGSSAFQGCNSGLTIHGYAGSTAETYAGKNSIAFVALASEEPEPVVTLTEGMFTVDTSAVTYTGQPVTKSITGRSGDKSLIENTDYTVTYGNNTDAGTATITITGKGNYTGTVTKTFAITPASLSGLTPTLAGSARAGKALTAKLEGVAAKEYTWVWTVGGVEVTGNAGSGYTVRPEDSGKTVTVRAVAKTGGNYTGSTRESAALTVEKVTISGSVTIAIQSKAVEGAGNTDVIQVGDTVKAAVSVIPASAGTGGSIQWFRNGEESASATGETYIVQEGDDSLKAVYTPADDYKGTLSDTIEVGKIVLGGEIKIKNDTQTGGEPAVNDVLSINRVGEKELVEENGAIKLKDGDTAIIVLLTWYRDGEPIEGVNGLKYTLTKADQGKTITARLKPQDSGSYAGTLTASISVPAAKPDKPTGSASRGNGTVTVTWMPPADNGTPITEYIVYLENGERVELGADVTSHTFTGLTNGTTYNIVIIAVNAKGEGPAATIQATPTGSFGGSGGGGSPSGGGSSGSGSSTAKRNISAAKVSNGSVSISEKNAKSGDKVTVTVIPDKGYRLEKLVIVDKKGKAVTFAELGEGKYTFTMPASEVTITPTFTEETEAVEPPSDPKPSVSVTELFSDVRDRDWFCEAIQYVYDKGVMSGLTQDAFGPDTLTSRAMIVTILYRLEGEPEVSAGGFIDIDADMYYSDAVSWASANGIVAGFEDATFRPDEAVTREQLAVILYRYAQATGKDVTVSADISAFEDTDTISAWAMEAMSWAVGNGLLQGMGNNNLNPSGSAIRAQVAMIMMRYCESEK